MNLEININNRYTNTIFQLKKIAVLLLTSFVTIWQKMGEFREGRGVWSALISIHVF